MVMGSPCPSIPVMIVGAILTAILIFVGVQLIPESDITTQETTTQEATKMEVTPAWSRLSMVFWSRTVQSTS